MCFICYICLHFGVGVHGVILRPLSGPFRGLRRPGRNLTPFNRTFPRVASKTTYSKVLVPIWSIWCQTCPGVPEPVRNRIFVRRSPPIFVHLVAHWPWLPFFGIPETAQKLSIRKAFVSFWSIWCQTGHNYFSVSQHNVPQPSKPPFRLTFVPFWSSWRQTCPGGNFLASGNGVP